MAVLDLRPRSAIELIDVVIQIYKRDAIGFIVVAAVIFVPWEIIHWTLLVDRGTISLPGPVGQIVLNVGQALIYTLSTGVVASFASGIYLGRPMSLGTAFRMAGRRILALSAASLAEGIIVVAGLVLLVVPGLIAIAAFSVLRAVVLFEDVDLNGAFARSAALSKGLRGHALLTMLCAAAIFFLVSMGVGVATVLLPNPLARQIVAIAIVVLLSPLWGIMETVLYYDMRIRKEGFDVEYLAAQVGVRGNEPGTTGAVNAPAL